MLIPAFAINLIGLALPIVVLQVYDRILPNVALDTFSLLMGGLIILVVVEAFLRVGRSWVMSWIGARFEYAASMAAFDRLLAIDVLAYEKEASGTHLDRLQGLDAIRDYYSGQAATVVVDLPFVIVFLGLIYFMAGWLVVVPLGLLILFSAIALYLAQKSRVAVEKRTDLDDRRYNFVIEALTGVHTVKSMAMEPLMIRRYERLQAQSADAVRDLSERTTLSHGLGMAFSQIAMAAVVAVGAVPAMNGDLSIGALAAATLLTGRVLQPVLRAMGIWTQYQQVTLAKQRMDEIYDLPLEREVPGRARPTLAGRIVFERVSFRYTEDGPLLLDGADLVVEPGETVGFTGANGVGKSAVFGLVLGLLKPTGGRILIDDVDVADIDPHHLRSQMAYMPQYGALFQGTLLENMTNFRAGEAIPEAVRLAQHLGLEDAITRLPNGLDTRVADSAVETLPDGVRQRIVMVRAMVGDPPMILFDDANTSLDRKADNIVRSYFERIKGTRSVLLTTHRPSLLSICDRCFRLNEAAFEPMPVPRAGARAALKDDPGPAPLGTATRSLADTPLAAGRIAS